MSVNRIFSLACLLMQFHHISCFSTSRFVSSVATKSASALKTLPYPAAQLLEFQEPQTNVTVVLVGAMHYNPLSIKLAKDTVQVLGSQDKLGSVIVESCDIRWNKTADLYQERPLLKLILNNEMRTACDVAISFGRPVVLGDQRINITSDALKSSLKNTLIDLVTPPKGWMKLIGDVTNAWEETAPLGGKGYLNAFAFFDPRLLLVLPVSLVKYPLSFLVRDPLPTAVVLSTLIALSYTDDTMTVQDMMSSDVPLSDWIVSFSLAVLETVVFARLLLRTLLAERNKVLAKNILEQCKLYTTTAQHTPSTKVRKDWLQKFIWQNTKQTTSSLTLDEVCENIYAQGSPVFSTTNKADRVVVAVLGMAHCNGIMKLLKEKRV